MAGSSTAELRLRPTREDDLDYVVAAEAHPDNAPFLAPSPREDHARFMSDRLQSHLIAEADGRASSSRTTSARARSTAAPASSRRGCCAMRSTTAASSRS